MDTAQESLLERLRQRTDWRLTAQRRVIAEAFGGEHVHLAAEEVLARARRRMPEISLATVYNTLNELVALGELQPVHGGRGRGRVALPRSQRFGHRVVGQETVFKGYCVRCRKLVTRGHVRSA